jgi:hypothetical protein
VHITLAFNQELLATAREAQAKPAATRSMSAGEQCWTATQQARCVHDSENRSNVAQNLAHEPGKSVLSMLRALLDAGFGCPGPCLRSKRGPSWSLPTGIWGCRIICGRFKPMRPLPIWEIVKQSVSDVLVNSKGFIAIAALWIAIAVSLWAAGMSSVSPTVTMILLVGGSLLSWLGILAVIVAWHRHVILNEPLTGPMAIPRWRVLLYALKGFIVTLLGSLACFPVMVLSSMLLVVLMSLASGSHTLWIEGIIMFVLFLPAMMLYAVVGAKLLLVLPGTAVTDYAMTLRRSWELTRGNTWRLIAAILLLGVIVGMGFLVVLAVASAAGVPAVGIYTGPMGWNVSYEAGSATSSVGMTASLFVVQLLATTLSYIGAVLFAALLSLAYRHLARPTGETTSPLQSRP